jgi:hypothetical protein
MKILEFDLPSFYMPKEPYWIRDLNMVLLSTETLLPSADYYQPKFYTKMILYDFDPKTFKKSIIDFVTFSNFLNQNYPLMSWIQRRSFSDHLKYQSEIDDLEKYVFDTFVKTDWYLTIDFDKYPLLELTPKPNEINFRDNFVKFTNLHLDNPSQSKLRNLIDFFAYNYLSSSTLNRIYDNTNLQVNNSFIMIESLINLENLDQKGYEICPNCQYKIPRKKKMLELVKEYVNTKTDNPEIQEIFYLILKEHYKVRNDFSHTAKYGNSDQKMLKMLKKLGRDNFTLKDEIEHADATQQGIYIINSFIRIELLQKLENNSST